jgi:hypothetical protein
MTNNQKEKLVKQYYNKVFYMESTNSYDDYNEGERRGMAAMLNILKIKTYEIEEKAKADAIQNKTEKQQLFTQFGFSF